MARDRTYKPPVNGKKYLVTQTEIDQVRDDAKEAELLLKNPLLKRFCGELKATVLDIYAKQLTYDEEEETITNGVKTVKHFPAQKEQTLLAGEYRFIDRLYGNLEQSIFFARELDTKIKNNEIEVKPEDGE